MKVDYIIYNPNGNITALVLDDKYSKHEKKKINDEIMKKKLNKLVLYQIQNLN